MSHLRVVTWNVHGCVGRDGTYSPMRTAELIRRLAPDVLALQEVDSRRRSSDDLDVFDSLRAVVGDHAVDARTISTVDGHYGQMLISRWPLQDRQVHDLSVPGREPRKAIEAQVIHPSGRLRFVATHLGLSWRERGSQLCRLAHIVRRNPELPLILLGDLNEWLPIRRSHRELAKQVPARSRRPTFPASLPLLSLDRICCRPAGLMKRAWVTRDGRTVSDHLPVIAEIRLTNDGKAMEGDLPRENRACDIEPLA